MDGVNPALKAGLGAMLRNFRQYYMRRRPDWNHLGPPLPLWFKAAVKRVDRRLVLQFIPPRSIDPEGVPSAMFPLGVWYICGKIPRSPGWLTKRAIFALADEQGNPVHPTWDIIKLLREAKWDRRREGASRLEQEFEESIEALGRTKEKQERAKLTEIVVKNMRRMNMTSSCKPRVSMHIREGGGKRGPVPAAVL